MTVRLTMLQVMVRCVELFFRYSIFFPDKDEETFQGCGNHFKDDDDAAQKTWIGCDGCWRW